MFLAVVKHASDDQMKQNEINYKKHYQNRNEHFLASQNWTS